MQRDYYQDKAYGSLFLALGIIAAIVAAVIVFGY